MIPLSVIVGSAAGIAAGFGLAWQMQAHTITQIHLDSANERISIQRANREATEGYMQRIQSAQANTTNRVVALRAAVVSAGDVGNGLRIKTTDAVRAATSDPALCSDTAATLGKLFDASATEYRELAERTDRHVIDIQALIEREQR